MDRKRVFKHGTRKIPRPHCTYGILQVKHEGWKSWDVLSDSKDWNNNRNVYHVRLNMHPDLICMTCDCPKGTIETGNLIIDELHRCRHIVAVRLSLGSKM